MIKAYINTEINTFQLHSLLSGKDLFRKVGPRNSVPSASGLPDEITDSIPLNSRKLDQLESIEAYDSYMQSVEFNRSLEAKESAMEPSVH